MISHMGLSLSDGGGTEERTERDRREGARTRSWGSGIDRVHFAVVPRTSLRRKT